MYGFNSSILKGSTETLVERVRADAKHLEALADDSDTELLPPKGVPFLAAVKPFSLLTRAARSGPVALAVYLAVRHKRNLDGQYRQWSVISNNDLAKLHLSDRQFRRVLPRLEAAGLIETKSRGAGKRVLVRLTKES